MKTRPLCLYALLFSALLALPASAQQSDTVTASAAPASSAASVPAAAPAAQDNPPAQQPAATPAPSGPTWYPFTAVSGIYMASSDPDLGKLTGIKLFEGIHFRGWVEGYYDYNFNNPTNAVVNALSPAIVAPNETIQGRTFDVHSNSFTLNLAELEVEKIPDRGQVGFKFDIAFGDTQNIYNDTILAGCPTVVGNNPNCLSLFDKTFQQASVSYDAPIGKGLRIDFGKFVTHIGGETIEGVKNANSSHSFFYTYAIPFQDFGLRLHYDFNAKYYNELYVLNGWNTGFGINRGKTIGYTMSYMPSPKFMVVGNYLGGPQQVNNTSNWRHLGDFQIYFNTPRFRTMTNIDVAQEANALGAGKDVSWQGVAEVLRYRLNDHFDPSVRIEWYRDPQGFTTGTGLKNLNMMGYTLTLDTFLYSKEESKILLRPEFRYDHTNADFFSVGRTPGLTSKAQPTVGVSIIYYFD